MKYAVHINYNAWQRVEVEADSEEEATDKAFAISGVCLCHQCARELDLSDITGDFDIEELE